jgi:hypothetical protein
LLIGLTVAGALCLLPTLAERGATRGEPRIVAVQSTMVVVAGLLLVRSAAKGNYVLDGPSRDLYDAQVWAQRHTPASAVFIVEGNVAWRVVSRRRMVSAFPTDGFVYTRSRAAFEHTLAVRDHVAKYAFQREADVLDFRRRFAGDYLVRWTRRQPLFTRVYQNPTYSIYRLPAASRRD